MESPVEDLVQGFTANWCSHCDEDHFIIETCFRNVIKFGCNVRRLIMQVRTFSFSVSYLLALEECLREQVGTYGRR